MFDTPTTQVWHQLFEQGKLNAAQSTFWQTKPVEELYDLKTDPDEVNNLAGLDKYREVVANMRDAQQQWERRIKDAGFLSEWEIHSRSKGSSPYEMGHDARQYDFEAVFAAANLASSLREADLPEIAKLLHSNDPAVRYWGAIGLLAQEKKGVAIGHDQLVDALKDASPIVQITAAEAIGRFGTPQDTAAALKVLLHYAQPEADAYLSMAAWNSLDYLDEQAQSAAQEIHDLSPAPKNPPPRYGDYGKRLKQETIVDLH